MHSLFFFFVVVAWTNLGSPVTKQRVPAPLSDWEWIRNERLSSNDDDQPDDYTNFFDTKTARKVKSSITQGNGPHPYGCLHSAIKTCSIFFRILEKYRRAAWSDRAERLPQNWSHLRIGFWSWNVARALWAIWLSAALAELPQHTQLHHVHGGIQTERHPPQWWPQNQRIAPTAPSWPCHECQLPDSSPASSWSAISTPYPICKVIAEAEAWHLVLTNFNT